MKVGHFTDKGFCSYATGSADYCQGWADGYNLYADIPVHVLSEDGCQCGPDRQPTERLQYGFMPRLGCLRCDNWDTPARLSR